MKIWNAIMAMAATALALCGCMTQTVELSTSDTVRNAFADSYATWHAGESTFEDMQEKYGRPANVAKLENGFAARWLREERVVVTNERNDWGNPVTGFEKSMRGPVVYRTVKSSMEAFFNANGVLRNFRIEILE